LFALEVGLCGWVDAGLGDGDAVEGAVELAVAAAVERWRGVCLSWHLGSLRLFRDFPDASSAAGVHTGV
jgi:hypothetical protein